MTNTINLATHSVLSNTMVYVTNEHTTYAYKSLIELPDITLLKQQHSKITKIAKEKGIKINRKHKTLANAKSIFEEAKSEFEAYSILFQKYLNFWNGKVVNNVLCFEEQDDLNEGYDISTQLERCLYRNTKLSQYLDDCSFIEEALNKVESKCKDSTSKLTIYI